MGVAAFREEVARGMAQSAKVMDDAKLIHPDPVFHVDFEAIKHFAEQGTGNGFFSSDGSVDGMEQTMKQMMVSANWLPMPRMEPKTLVIFIKI